MQRHRIEGEKEQLENQLTSAEEQVIRSEKWLESIVTDAKEADFQLKDMEIGNKSANQNLEKIKKKHKDVLKSIEKYQKDLSDLEGKLRNLSMKLASKEAAQRAREEFGGYAKGVKAILQCRDEGKLSGIIGTVAELGRVDKEYATALEVAAGARLQSIVTENDRAAAEAIEFLKRNNIGRVRFLPLNKIHSYKPSAAAILISKKPGAVGFAQNLVKFDPRYKDAFGNVFGDTVIIDSLSNARRHLGKGRMVTLQGELLESGGALVGGAAPRTGISFGTEDRTEIDNLTAKIGNLDASMNHIFNEKGSNDADGPYVELGFKPACLWLVKRTGSSFHMWDSARMTWNPAGGAAANGNAYPLSPNQNISESSNGSGGVVDLLSNRFKVRSTWGDINGDNNDILYMPWAESPFSNNTMSKKHIC